MPPHITPFAQDESIDEAALRELIHFWIDAGCAGLVSCGSNGEAPSLSKSERMKVLRIVLDEVSSKIPVIGGTGAPSTRETIELTKDAKEAGCAAVIVVTPYYFRPDNREIFSHYCTIMNAVDIPVLAYNVPKFTGYNLEPEIVSRLAEEYSQLVGVKESGGSIGQLSELVRMVGSRLSVLAGSGDLLLPGLALGARGGILGITNVFPKLCVSIYDSFKNGDLDRARTMQVKLTHLNDVLMKKFNQISSIKEAMNQMDLPAGYPRRPSLPLDKGPRQEIGELLKSVS